jgi:hypothetical protein
MSTSGQLVIRMRRILSDINCRLQSAMLRHDCELSYQEPLEYSPLISFDIFTSRMRIFGTRWRRFERFQTGFSYLA